MVYDAWRVNGGLTQHGPNPTPVTVDVLEVGFIFAISVIAFCLALIVPGYRGWPRLFFCCRAVVSLFILSAVLLGVLGQEWASAELHTRTPYKAFSSHEIEADVGMKIGLASVNITLKTNPVTQPFGNNVTETINYNERFHWDWRQGRGGFGPFAGRIQQEYREAQFRGIPLPILWIAKYFTLDGVLIRWGRSFRTAGWFTYIILWTAFPTWIIANLLSVVVLFYAGFMFFITGGLMLISTITWSSIRWGHQPLAIPFEDGILIPHHGPSYWLVVSGGLVSCLYGATVVCMDLWAPRMIAEFFGNDILQDPQEFFHNQLKNDDEDESLNATEDAEAATLTPALRHRGEQRRLTVQASTFLNSIIAISPRRISRDVCQINLPKKVCFSNRTCAICGKMFLRKKSLFDHHRKFHENILKQFSKTFSEENDSEKHKTSVHILVDFCCKKCSETFNDEKSLEEHEKECSERKSSGVRFQSVTLLSYHTWPQQNERSDAKRKAEPHVSSDIPLKQARTSSIEFLEKESLDSVEDDELKATMKLYWTNIGTYIKRGKCRNEYNFMCWGDLSKMKDYISETIDTKRSSKLKVMYSFGYILKDPTTSKLSYHHPSLGSSLWTKKVLMNNREELHSFLLPIAEEDVHEQILKSNKDCKLEKITNISFQVDKIRRARFLC